MKKFIAPSVELGSFNCPHCGALAHQYWYSLYGDEFTKDSLPNFPNEEWLENVKNSENLDSDMRGTLLSWYENVYSKKVFMERENDATCLRDRVWNLHLSKCYSCNEFSVWQHEQIIWPRQVVEYLPNEDIPADIVRDFNEAAEIVSKSPRGAAALLRLCIQKLCNALGEPGQNLNNDIASLVQKGLDSRIQKALDVVRVIGNNAVHPGQIDLADRPATAQQLFGLVNLIADAMISQPKHVKAMFEGLPASAKAQIENRDKEK